MPHKLLDWRIVTLIVICNHHSQDHEPHVMIYRGIIWLAEPQSCFRGSLAVGSEVCRGSSTLKFTRNLPPSMSFPGQQTHNDGAQREWVRSRNFNAERVHECRDICKQLNRVTLEVRRLVQCCCYGRWIQAAVLLGEQMENVSLLAFYLKFSLSWPSLVLREDW